MSSPILFCHYGNSDYLKFTLRAAKLFNPSKRIILLGDDANRGTALAEGAEHFLFKDLSSADLDEFEKVYRHVAGEKHGKEFWTNFVFKRWFYVHAFLKTENINAFWHFDSDNILLTDLGKQENKFKTYDCTEQCSGGCMNGFISSFDVVDGYVKKINALFRDQQYLQKQQDDFAEHAHFAFTEMRAYQTFKEQQNIRSIRLSSIINGETFDDCICQQDDMETYETPLKGQYLKKLFYTKDGFFYCRSSVTHEFIKMNSLNMSWVPTYLYTLILSKAKISLHKTEPPAVTEKDLQLLDIYSEPLSSRFNNIAQRIKNKLFS